MNLLREVIVLFLCQILIALIVHEVAWVVWDRLISSASPSLVWGITLRIAGYVYLATALCLSVLLGLSKRFGQGLAAFLACYCFFVFLFIQGYQYVPYRTILLLLSALVGMLVAFLLRVRRINTASDGKR